MTYPCETEGMSKFFVPLVTRFALCLDFHTCRNFRDRVVLFLRMHDSLGAAFGEVVIMNLTLTFYEKERDPNKEPLFLENPREVQIFEYD